MLLAVLLLVLLPLTALAAHHALKVASKDGVGSYLTDTEGKTLYWFKNDTPGNSACSGPCVEKWPVYFRDAVKAPEGIAAADFGTIQRADGAKQTTFRGYPLYYWVGDKAAGDTTGHKFKEVWFVVDPKNFPPK
jgi:predicted lipoprotein with Yx(FWY)xxD motif